MIDSATRRTAYVRGQLTDPYSASLLVVTMMPVLSAIAFGSILWRPLGYVVAVASLFYVQRLHRWIGSGLQRIGPGASTSRMYRATTYLVIVLLAAMLSIPVVQVFFRGDLAAMAAPTIVAEMTDGWQGATTPDAIYGSTPTWPSYAPCQFVQEWTGLTVANSCYSAVGYVRMWQMPTALPMLCSLTMIYILFPLTLARFGRLNK
ncbi:hypothetical protein FFI94_008890 [Rhodococcus sp. KBS0724]|uniref:hypothetical protein n=1 Tax=Rhodococcus sp. KBS0724 TaxID=1179674 RepID=UPI00110D7687|nr:hypothetical protein [Rhodococcus sp. KBS0724]TSD46265.1 hypothetical protein FFI94_008890 [Rhodococcus sp. KBS0724]